ncbi:MAG: beta-ketoacyl-ACP synthase II [Oscillospiraceae bacterium]|nr:beta-ketoacyl-ACP synthase II [Oscillospiraceae bacterium]
MRRVVVTGVGVKSPVGLTKDSYWDSLVAGRHGFKEIDRFDTSDIPVKLAGSIEDFVPTDYFDKKELRKTDRFCQFAVASALDALSDCGSDLKDIDPYRVGVIVSSGIGGFESTVNVHADFLQKGPERVSPFFVPMMISNMGAGIIAIKTGFKGINHCPVTACASSAHSIGEAFRNIKHGYIDACIAGGAEATILKFTLAAFNNMTALSRSADPDRASIPFDAERNGFVMGEGSGMLVLEEYELAKKRGAKIYAEITGYGATCDAFHFVQPRDDGEGAAKSMQFAIDEAGLSPQDITYINAHGTSTKANDAAETRAVKTVFGQYADKVAISSTKSMTGHLLGAAGAIESIACVLAIKDGIMPPTIGYKVSDPDCDLDYITQGTRKQDVTAALTNSLGFGGHNATLCYKKI